MERFPTYSASEARKKFSFALALAGNGGVVDIERHGNHVASIVSSKWGDISGKAIALGGIEKTVVMKTLERAEKWIDLQHGNISICELVEFILDWCTVENTP